MFLHVAINEYETGFQEKLVTMGLLLLLVQTQKNEEED